MFERFSGQDFSPRSRALPWNEKINQLGCTWTFQDKPLAASPPRQASCLGHPRLNHLLADMEEARNYFLSFQPYSTLYFIIFQILQVVISVIPGELTGFLGGFIFGAIPGFLYSMIGLTTGSAIAVTIGRIFKKVFLERIIPARILDMFGKRVGKWGLLTVFIFYLIPGAPKDYMCYLIGLSRIPLLRFIIVSSLGRMPATLVLSLEGGKVVEGDWVFSAVLAIASLVILIPLLVFSDRIQRYFGIKD